MRLCPCAFFFILSFSSAVSCELGSVYDPLTGCKGTHNSKYVFNDKAAVNECRYLFIAEGRGIGKFDEYI